MQISPNIHSIPVTGGLFWGFYRPNVYLMVGEEAALVDSGYGDDTAVSSTLEYLKGLGPLKLAYIVITHSHIDHIGGAERLKEATGAQIVTHSLDAPMANSSFSSTTVDKLVEDGDTIGLGGIELKVIHTPGHSPGHICLYMKEEKILFSGDNVVGVGTTAITPPQGNMAQYINSLRKLLGHDIQLICPGHGSLIREGRRKIGELIQHRLEREEQVLTCLKQGKNTVREMVGEIYPELDSCLLGMAQGQVLAHLIKLEMEDRVVLREVEGERIYAIR